MGTIKSISHDGLHTLEFNEGRHVYVLDGQKVPGATDVKKAYPPSEGLIQYFIKQGIEEYKSGKRLKRQATVGTFMHDYAYTLRTGKTFDEAPLVGHEDEAKIRKRMRLVEQHVRDSNDKVVMAEEIIASVAHQYGGKFDVLVEREGKLILQDYKSSKRFFEDQFLQLGGYAQALEEWKNIRVDGLEVIRFADDADEPRSFSVLDPVDVKEFRDEFVRLRFTRKFQWKWKTFFEEKYKKDNPWVKTA